MASGWKKVTEATMSETDSKIGSLTKAQFLEVVAEGLPIAEAKGLAAEGFDYDELMSLARAAGKPKADGGLTREEFKEVLDLQEKARNPSNPTHPGVSVYSHPDGDRAHPKPPMPYELFWNNYPVHKFPETETWREWELQMQLQPGEYRILRKDGTPMAVTVRGETDASGKLVKVWVEHNVTREEKWLVPPKPVVLHQLIHPGNLRQAFMDGMNEHLQSLMG